MRCRWLVALGCVLIGCSEKGPTTAEPEGCAVGEHRRDDGACVSAGVPPDMPCPPGEQPAEQGACVPAGVPPDGCGEGFVHDGDGGCTPALPTQACPAGMLALPGEASCRPVAPCESGTWGGIPVDASTEHVDASYTGGASDGSAAAPWTTIQAGVDAAMPGAIVAVAAGSYAEDVIVQGKPVRLWARCPELVELVGTGGETAALFFRAGASGSEVHRLAITGGADGVLVMGAENVIVDEVWAHDNARIGVSAVSFSAPTGMTVSRSLIEGNVEVGIFVSAARATVDRSVVRDIMPDAQGRFGRGIEVLVDSSSGARGSLTVSRSLVERNRLAGVLVYGSDAEVEATVVRDTQMGAQGTGRGIEVMDDPETQARASVVVSRSLIANNHESGLFVLGSDADIEATVVRDTLGGAQNLLGRGIEVQESPGTGGRSTLAVSRSLIEGNQRTGVLVVGSDAALEASIVRRTLPDAQGFGRGIEIRDNPASLARSIGTVSFSLLEQNQRTGIFVWGSDASVEASVVRDTLPDVQGMFGRSLEIQRSLDGGGPASATVVTTLLEGSSEAGILVAGPATLSVDGSEIRRTTSRDGIAGDGLLVWSLDGPVSATVSATRIADSERAAVSSFGATVALEHSLMVCQSFDLGAESFAGQSAHFDAGADTLCGCPEATEPCLARSYSLEPPPAVGGIE